jgi:hypothetical protein
MPGGAATRGGVTYTLAAWRGVLLAGFASRPVPDGADGFAPAVVRRQRDPAAREATARLVEAFGMSGLVEITFTNDRSSPGAAAVEVRRWLPPLAHAGAKIGVDLCGALRAAIEGAAPPARAELDDGEWHDHVRFPDEWLRDPDSRWLRTHPVDVPWDEPELFEALLALGPGAHA